jgi:hypothetical protein
MLAWEILADSPLVSVHEQKELKGRLEVWFDGQPVQRLDIRPVLVRIANAGNVAIATDDRHYPPTVLFGKETGVLTADIDKTGPQTFQAERVQYPDRVEIKPLLLNPGEYITLRLLVKGWADAGFDAHIKGGVVIDFTEDFTPTPLPTWRIWVVWRVILVVIVILVVLNLIFGIHVRTR